MYSEDVTGADPEEFWDPRMRASIEMTEQLATEIHEEVQELRKELRQLAAAFKESMKKLVDRETKSGEQSPLSFLLFRQSQGKRILICTREQPY